MALSSILPEATWKKYRAVLDGINGSFANKEILWYKYKKPLDVYMEDFGEYNRASLDNPTNYTHISLKVLLNHNYMRTWPIDANSISGKNDRQTEQVFINRAYLSRSGYLSPSGNMAYNPDYDRFKIDGIIYRPVGDTAASQAGSTDVLYLLILQREERESNEATIR